MCRVLRASQYLKYFVSYYILKCWSWKTWKKVIFRYFWSLNKGSILKYYSFFNDIRCNFKALLNIFLHFGMDKMYQKGFFFLLFPFFTKFCLATLAGFSHRQSYLFKVTTHRKIIACYFQTWVFYWSIIHTWSSEIDRLFAATHSTSHHQIFDGFLKKLEEALFRLSIWTTHRHVNCLREWTQMMSLGSNESSQLAAAGTATTNSP
jgi:hypothetical protein